MATPRVRGGNSGPPITPLPGIGNPRFLPASGPETFTLLPAGHPRGQYTLSAILFTITTGTGTYTTAYGWDQDGFGPATLAFGAINLATAALTQTLTRAIYSSGNGPITFTITPAAVGGAPVLNIICSSVLTALPVPD